MSMVLVEGGRAMVGGDDWFKSLGLVVWNVNKVG
jgi:hypothetical protein